MLYGTFALYTPSDDGPGGVQRTWELVKYGKFICQFQPDIIASIR